MYTFRHENERRLAYWVMGIGYILFDKLFNVEVDVVDTQLVAYGWVNEAPPMPNII